MSHEPAEVCWWCSQPGDRVLVWYDTDTARHERLSLAATGENATEWVVPSSDLDLRAENS